MYLKGILSIIFNRCIKDVIARPKFQTSKNHLARGSILN